MSGLKHTFTDSRFYYLVCLCLTIFSSTMRMMSYTGFDGLLLHDIILLVSLLSAFICFILSFRKYSWKQAVTVGGLALMGILCFLKTGATDYFMCLMCIGLSFNLSVDEMLRFVFAEKIIIFSAFVLLSGFGLIPETTVEVAKGTYSIIGYGSGYMHPNSLSKDLAVITLLFLAIKRKNIRWHHLLTVLIVTVLNYKITQCRIGFMIPVLAVMLVFLSRYRVLRDVMKGWFRYVYPFLFVLMFFLFWLCDVFGYENRIVEIFNGTIFNGRIVLAHMSIQVFGVSFLGTEIDIPRIQEYIPDFQAFDNGQGYVLVRYGIAGVLTFGFIFDRIMKRLRDYDAVILGIITACLLLWSAYEFNFFDVGVNFTLLLFAAGFATCDNAGSNRVELKEGKTE